MEDYSFAADLLATFRASPDFIKALLVLVPPLFTLALLKLLLSGRKGRLDRGRALMEVVDVPPDTEQSVPRFILQGPLLDQPKFQQQIALKD